MNRLRHNFTSQSAPHFVLRDLRSLHPLRFRLYAVNARGVSENSEIPVVMVNQPEKHTDTSEKSLISKIKSSSFISTSWSMERLRLTETWLDTDCWPKLVARMCTAFEFCVISNINCNAFVEQT